LGSCVKITQDLVDKSGISILITSSFQMTEVNSFLLCYKSSFNKSETNKKSNELD